MKQTKFFLSLLVTALFVISATASEKEDQKKFETTMPDNVVAVVEKSCFGCHNTDSRNDDAKEELDFKTLNDLNPIKKIGTYRDIAEMLEEDKMPPKKFLEKYPDRAPTSKEEKLLHDWVKKEAQRLIDSQ